MPTASAVLLQALSAHRLPTLIRGTAMEDEETSGPGYDPIAEEFATCVSKSFCRQALLGQQQPECRLTAQWTCHGAADMKTIWTARSLVLTCTTWRTLNWHVSLLSLGECLCRKSRWCLLMLPSSTMLEIAWHVFCTVRGSPLCLLQDPWQWRGHQAGGV